MCCLTVIHHQQQLPTPTPLVTVARWRSCPPCRTFCLGWPNPIAPLKSFCFAARNSLPVWRKVPNNMTYVTPPPRPHSIPTPSHPHTTFGLEVCLDIASNLQQPLTTHYLQSQLPEPALGGVSVTGWTQDVKLSGSDTSLDLNRADPSFCCCWLLGLPLVTARGGPLLSHRHMAEENLIRPKVRVGRANLLASGWFIIPWGNVALLGPNRTGVKGHTVSVPFVKASLATRFCQLGIKGCRKAYRPTE